MKKITLKYTCAVISGLLLNVSLVSAQKSSDMQEGNLLVSKIKVDGNSNDWTTPLKAFNKSTGLHYTVANDDKKIYIIIQTSEVNTTRKILMGGITFSINADGKKKSAELASLTYPVITGNSRRSAMGGGGSQRSFGNYQTMTQAQRDSMQLAFGQRQLEAAKDIKIHGFKTVTDTLVSIYNEYSIKAMATLNATGTYTYEIAIPLALLPVDTDKEFGYNVKVNGLQMRNLNSGNNTSRLGGGNGGGRPAGGTPSGGRGGFDFQDLMTPTDFSGKYTLAK
ncbi:hypothetical protein [Pedobacter arcticus]|uniref:hypothetical protein n=1 Tax=Pedobacter arcticus TaxID=752140 RepID=UPI00030E0EB3|nr:hypothetical protein [Pedobacter arcticus]